MFLVLGLDPHDEPPASFMIPLLHHVMHMCAVHASHIESLLLALSTRLQCLAMQNNSMHAVPEYALHNVPDARHIRVKTHHYVHAEHLQQ